MSSPHQAGLLVIGSGPAGVHAACAYRETGGPGPVRILSADRDAPYQRPPLSKEVLAGECPPELTPVLDDAALATVEVRLDTRVERLDLARRCVRTATGDVLGFDRLVVATGATPRTLPDVDPDAHPYVLRSLADARTLVGAAERARRAVVVGSGFIGCEAAASLAARGVRTALVLPDPVPHAARLGEVAGERVAGWLRDAGVTMHPGRRVTAVRPEAVVLDDGSSLETDLVLSAVGVTPSQPVLEGSGLELTDGRVEVDEQLRSGDPAVWAAGDVARARHGVVGRPLTVEHWGDAVAMGRIAGHNAAADGARPSGRVRPQRWESPPGFWSTIAGRVLKYSAWGDGYTHARVVGGPEAFTVWYIAADGEVVGVLTHERDDDYARGQELLARRASAAEVPAPASSPTWPRPRTCGPSSSTARPGTTEVVGPGD